MKAVNKHDPKIYELFKESIEQEVRSRLFHDITKKLVKEFSEKVEEELKPMLKEITIETLERVLSMDAIGDEFRVHVKVGKP